jgi:outer membrane beta-barrel protein
MNRTAGPRPIALLLGSLLLWPALAPGAPGDAAPGADDKAEEDEKEEEKRPGESSPGSEPEPEATPAPEPEPEPEPTPSEEPAPAPEDGGIPDLPPAGEDSEPEKAPEEAPSRDADEEDEEEQPSDDGARARRPDGGGDEGSARARKKAEAPEEKGRRSITKVLQKKFFLKYRRVEIAPQFGYIGNDNFIRRMSLGGSVTFHVNDILGLEIFASGLPDLGNTDYKPLVSRLRDEEEVVPDISRVTFIGTFNIAVSPIYGKVELGAVRIINYDLFLTAGAGLVHSKDDLEIIGDTDCGNPPYETAAQRQADLAHGCNYVDQEHFVTNWGGGLRIVFNEWIGVRLDFRQFTHIEQVFRDGDVGLEMKQNFLVGIGASFFLPPQARIPL